MLVCINKTLKYVHITLEFLSTLWTILAQLYQIFMLQNGIQSYQRSGFSKLDKHIWFKKGYSRQRAIESYRCIIYLHIFINSCNDFSVTFFAINYLNYKNYISIKINKFQYPLIIEYNYNFKKITSCFKNMIQWLNFFSNSKYCSSLKNRTNRHYL